MKILPKISIPNEIKIVLDGLNDAGYEAYVVGGSVRDSLMGKDPHDWDITTSATPIIIKKTFKNYKQIDTGLRHGTITIMIGKMPIEITTYRVDDKYSDGRRPDRVFFATNIAEDLARRDFTINACAMSETQIIDPFYGQQDIDNKIIRSVGNPLERFREDALRILRGIRFASQLGFQVEQKTKEAMLECKGLLKNISQERITFEFCKTLMGLNIYDTLMEFKDIIVFIIPEFEKTLCFNQHNKYHNYDVYRHSVKAAASIEKDIILKVAMLFHDIGKPECFTLDDNNVGHFYGHAGLSARVTNKILHKMRFPKRQIDDIVQLIKYHNRQISPTSKSVKRLLNVLGEFQFRRLLKIKAADAMAKNPYFLDKKLQDLKTIAQILDNIMSEDTCFSRRQLAINGRDLIQFGIPQGKKIGEILDILLRAVLEEEVENNREALINKVKNSVKQ